MFKKVLGFLKDEKGVHLLELLIGIGIVGMLGVIVYVGLKNFAPDFLDNFLNGIKNAIRIF
ncbi:hypothetical protein [Caldanaerobacter subterraneus]|uniref:Uncharacterized protein n=1 Tax=Caldanaerobacter subterraneus TaxID=911092 RepID=A0A7Y2L8D4_9THEO|nr:hypothetical protein [Caldanaerobacter subterraneus]NNG67562.1 hypothetical protein [Caldanaerobacter subterraneus]